MTHHTVPVVEVPVGPGVAAVRLVVAGIDTHSSTHHAAVLDGLGRELGDREFPATVAGYTALLGWVREHGQLATVGVEGTGSYGAGLARQLCAAGVAVVEIDRPDRRTRRARGKSDPIDAYAAARAALSGAHVVIPKARDGIVEAIRMLRVTRRGAVKARTQTTNQLKSLLVTAPPGLREHLRRLKTPALVKTCARLCVAEHLFCGRPHRSSCRRSATSFVVILTS
jgi:transposase